MTDEVIVVDGSHKEGGGQLLRNSFSYAALCQRACRVHSIRAGRTNPGLAPQHLESVNLIAHVCNGALKGAKPRSTDVTLIPGAITAADRKADSRTAGSVTLMLQSTVIPLAFAAKQSRLSLHGGTDVEFSPAIGYFEHVLCPTLKKMGLDVKLEVARRGFFPKGGGIVNVLVEPVATGATLRPIQLVKRGRIVGVHGECYVAGKLASTPTMKKVLKSVVAELQAVVPGSKIDVKETRLSSTTAVGDACGVDLYATTEGGMVFGASRRLQRGQAAEEMAKDVVAELHEELSAGAACVDQHLADQLILPMSLAAGKSRFICTTFGLHGQAAIDVAKLFVPEAVFVVQDPAPESALEELGVDPPPAGRQVALVECDGIGKAQQG
eukprot:Polyplicarium_translucidae@DN3119_c0_g2_i1.p2